MCIDLARLAERLAARHAPPAVLPEEHGRAAVAIVLRRDDETQQREAELEVLLLRRAERADDRWSGQISLPGGRASASDRDLAETSRRETHEEVGIDLAHAAELAGDLAPVQAKARGTVLPLWITPFVFVARGPLAPVAGPEAAEVFWFPLGRARDGALPWKHRYSRHTEQGTEERVLPAWRDGEHVVWGLTYEILSGFLRAVADERGSTAEHE